jgi:hypothetical protein
MNQKNSKKQIKDKSTEPIRYTNIIWKGEDAENPQLIKAFLRRAGYLEINNQKEAVKVGIRLMLKFFNDNPDFLKELEKGKAASPTHNNNGSSANTNGDPLS